jgi:hypothetical protein
MFKVFAHTKPSAPKSNTRKNKNAAPPNPAENPNIQTDWLLTSAFVATDDTNASVSPLIARSGI